jgi:drug/metabolite transporter (DMT)-like permease
VIERQWKVHPMAWLLAAVILRSINQLVMKFIALRSAADIFDYLLCALLVLSVVLLVSRAICWQKALEEYQLSFAYPFFGLTIISLIFFGYFLFGEEVNTHQIIGVGIIFSGICLISIDYRNRELHE